MEQLINCFNTESTENIAQYLLGMYLEHETPAGKLAGYIVDCEAYLGPDDEAAHSYGMRDTPRVRAMYELPKNYTGNQFLPVRCICFQRNAGFPNKLMHCLELGFLIRGFGQNAHCAMLSMAIRT